MEPTLKCFNQIMLHTVLGYLTVFATICGCQNMAVMEGEKPSDLSLRNLIIW